MRGAPARESESDFARRVLAHERDALDRLSRDLAGPFERGVDLLQTCTDAGGTVLVTGLGKSGLVGSKIAATLASLGIPAHAVHPSEAAHGDLGRFRPTDSAVCLSFSGETDEVVNLAGVLRQDAIPILAITGEPPGEAGAPRGGGAPRRSSLARLASVHLGLALDSEAGGPDFVAPTSSTTAMMALGDALALACARRRGFSDADFAKRHPGGSLGGLLRPVVDVLRFRVGKNLPLVAQSAIVSEALAAGESSGRRPGAILLVDGDGRLAGLFTDGDLRRLVLRDQRALARPISDVMTRNPRTLPSSALLRDAVRMVREFRQDEIPVVDESNRPIGILDVQDLVAMKLVDD